MVAEKSAADAFKRSRKGRGNNQRLPSSEDLAGVGEAAGEAAGEVAGRVASAVKGAYATGKEKMGLVGDLIEDQVITEGMDRLSRGALETLTTGGGVTGGQMWKKAVGQMGSGAADALLELGRGTHIAMTDTADRRKEALSRGEELVKKPWWYQAVNLKLNTADAMNEYGKVKENRESEWFKKNILNGPEGDVAREWEARGNREVEERKEKERVLAFPAAWAGGHGAAKPPHTPERVRELLESHRKDEERKDKTKAKSPKDMGWFRKWII